MNGPIPKLIGLLKSLLGMSRTLIQLLATFLTFEASFFLLKSNLGLSSESIAEIASSRGRFNTGVIESLCIQNVDTWIGLLLLMGAFVFQLWAAARKHYIHDYGSFDFADLRKALIVAGIILILCLFCSRYVSSIKTDKVISIIRTHHPIIQPGDSVDQKVTSKEECRPSFKFLNEAISFISLCLNQERYKELANSCTNEGEKIPEQVLRDLRAKHQQRSLPIMYSKTEFPMDASEFMLGVYGSELDSVKIKFFKQEGKWHLRSIGR